MSRKNLGARLRFEVLERDGFACSYCGRKAPGVVLVVDHVQPVKYGGKNVIENLVTACEPCNQGKSARLGIVHPKADVGLTELKLVSEAAEKGHAVMVLWPELPTEVVAYAAVNFPELSVYDIARLVSAVTPLYKQRATDSANRDWLMGVELRLEGWRSGILKREQSA